MRTTLRIVLALTLALALPAGSSAAPGAQPEPDQSAVSVLDQLSDFLVGLWSEIGCHIDPSGMCQQAPSPQSDIGCHIDPNGTCRD